MNYVFVLMLFAAVVNAQPTIKSGPMVGAVDMREAKIWLQTTLPAEVHIEYRDSAAPSKKFQTDHANTKTHDACTAVLIADSVEPGNTYLYDVFVNGAKVMYAHPLKFRTQKVWKYRSDAIPSFTFAIGSCHYANQTGYERFDSTGVEGSGYGSEYEIFDAIYKLHPDAMVWLGDNTYLREADWNSRSGILKRYSHTRATREMQPLLASTSNYAIWDDHDYGPNDSDKSFWGKNNTLEAFKLFWANPSYGVMDKPGITTSAEFYDVQVFMLDDRYYRSSDDRKDTTKTILGEHQIQWLIDALSASKSTFKIIAVGSQFLTDNLRKECFSRAPEERKRIIDLITRNKISGVMFITGDIHAAELSKLERPGTYPLYEFTSSSLTAGSNTGIADQSNTFRVQGTEFGKHNFGTITVSGPNKDRALTLQLHDKSGAIVWTRTLRQSELR